MQLRQEMNWPISSINWIGLKEILVSSLKIMLCDVKDPVQKFVQIGFL